MTIAKLNIRKKKIRLGKAVNLNEVLEHEDLFKAYPDLKKVKVKEISDLDARGVYSPNFDCIFISENLPTQEKIKIAHTRSTTRNTSERGICSRRKS